MLQGKDKTPAKIRCASWLANIAKHPGWLVAAWVVLGVMSTLVLVLYIVGTPVYFARFSTLCSDCLDESLTPAKAQTLHTLGISITAYATYWTVINCLFALVYCAIGLFIFSRKPGDRVTLFAAFSLVSLGASFPDIPSTLAALHPGWWLSVTLLDALGFPALICFLFVFPTGRFVPAFTRWIALGFAAVYVSGTLFSGSLFALPHQSRVLTLLVIFVVFGSLIGAQIYRYRRVSTQEERQQTKWVVFGVVIALVGFLLLAFLPLALLQTFFPLQRLSLFLSFSVITSVYLVLLLIPLSLAIAILRYRLWDIDIIIRRTLVYSLLTVCVAGIYVLVVVSLGAVFRAEGNLLISLCATILIALLFQSLRVRLQRGVNRLFYGQRDEPYTVIARLSRRLEETLASDAVLSTIAETVAQALKLPYAAILWRQEEMFELAASYGKPAGEPLVLPLIYQAEIVGQLQLAPRSPGETFTPADLRLLDDLARQVGLAAHAVRLATDLQKARERLVLAREEERRRLRRALHDDVGPTLASLSQRIDTACSLIPRDSDAAIAMLSTLKTQIKSTIHDIRRVAYELRPPVLDELGLVSAIREYVMQLQGGDLPRISIEAPVDLPPLPAAVEVAAYRIILEALTNVERHAHAPHCLVRLELAEARFLGLSISDDGRGLPADYRAGIGLISLRERVAELGGVCTITTKAPYGTCISVRLPL